MWNPQQYERFRDARRRPFFELLARVPVEHAQEVADLGCGTGDLTQVLAERWPAAQVWGVDASEAMVTTARARPSGPRVHFAVGDLAAWAPPPGRALDVVLSNAALHWIPGHVALLPRFAAWLAPGGTLAFQVPANFDAPSHRLVEELRGSPRFAAALAGTRPASAEPLLHYARAAWDAGLVDVDAWETTYVQVLPGEDAVLEWLLGTTLRPIVGTLAPAQATAFLEELRPLLRAAYPAGAHGTPFPFTRRFVVARRPG